MRCYGAAQNLLLDITNPQASEVCIDNNCKNSGKRRSFILSKKCFADEVFSPKGFEFKEKQLILKMCAKSIPTTGTCLLHNIKYLAIGWRNDSIKTIEYRGSP